jgi:CcmD family protein
MSNSRTEVPVQAQEGFVPAKTITTESLPATPLLYSAYGAVWLLLLLYVFVLARRLTKVERDLRDVSARMAKR